MKKSFFSLLMISSILTVLSAQRQMRPLTGNGVPKSIQYTIKPFENIEVLWLDGKIEVEFGASQSDISINTDENIFYLLQVTNTEGGLKLEIANNFKNRLWLEDDKTTIKIRTTSQPRQIVYKANADAVFKNINSSFLTVDKDENGNLTLIGKVSSLNITKSDNGNLDAQQLTADQTQVDSRGNGNVYLNTKLMTKQFMSGNGDILNVSDKAENPSFPKVKRVSVTFYNPDMRRREYYITGTNEKGKKFSYGLELGAQQSQKEYLPVGTTVFKNGKIVAVLKENDNERQVKL